MNKYIAILALMLFSLKMANAQSNTPVFFRGDIPRKNSIGIDFTYENSLYTQLGYNRILKIKNRDLSLGIAFGSPLLLLSDRNKKISVNSSLYLLNTNFNIRTQAVLSGNFYKDVLSKGQFMDITIGFFPGYYKFNYFLAGELSYKNNLFTNFNFSETSSVQGENILIYNTIGNFNFGINGGVSVKKRLEVKSRIFYNVARDFKNYPPYTQNIGVNFGLSWFM